MFSDAHVGIVLWRVRDEIMQKSPAGQYYEALFWKHSSEQVQIIDDHPEHDEELWRVTRMFIPGLEALLDGKGDTVRITEEQVKSLLAELDWYASVGSPSLREDIKNEQQRYPLENFVGMTMSEALNYINSNWPPGLTAEPTVGPVPVISTPVCMAGFGSDCLAEPSLLPDSNGSWAYYILNEVYFEYPSTWHVKQGAGPQHLVIESALDSPEASNMGGVNLFVDYLRIENVEQYDLLTLRQEIIIQPPVPIWKRPVSLPDFEGIEFLWKDQNAPAHLEVFLYDENDQIAVDLLAFVIDNQLTGLIDNPNAVNEIFPDFQHIVESFRFWKP